MKNFDLSACAVSIATAMVTTMRSGDDVARIRAMAVGEGFENISDWIASNAVKQSVALGAELAQARRMFPELFDEQPTAQAVDSLLPGKSASAAKQDQPSKGTHSHAENASVSNGADLTNISGAVNTSTAPNAEAPELQNFDAAAVFGGPNAAGSAMAQVAPPTADASIAPAVEPINPPLVPAPPVAVPEVTTSTNTTTAIASSVDLDSEGMPWDGRIHSSSKKKLVENGRWKLIRGVDKDLVESVKAEHLGGATPTPTGAHGLHPDANPLSVAAVNHATAQMGKPAPAATTGTPVAPAANGPITNFEQLMSAITSNGLKPEQINPVLQSFGIASMPVLATKQDLIPAVAAGLGL